MPEDTHPQDGDQADSVKKSVEAPTAVESTRSAVPAAVRPIRATVREFEADLNCGLVIDGRVHRKVTMRTVTAGDRRIFGDEKKQKNPSKLVTELLVSKIVAIDGLKMVQERDIKKMLGQDRDFLVWRLRNETLKNRDFRQVFKCSDDDCRADNEVQIPVAEIEETTLRMSDARRLDIQDGRCVFKVDLPEFGFNGVFGYADGQQQEMLGGRQITNPFDMHFEVIAMLCVDFNGEGKVRVDDIVDLDLEFLDALQAGMRGHRYGPNFAPMQACYSCGTEQAVRVDALDFLFGGPSSTGPKPVSSNG